MVDQNLRRARMTVTILPGRFLLPSSVKRLVDFLPTFYVARVSSTRCG